VASSDEGGLGSIGDFVPTFLALLVFTAAWGLLQFRDGTPWIGLALVPPLAIGMLSSASVRMVLGRSIGGFGMTFGLGLLLFGLMFGVAFGFAVLAASGTPAVAAETVESAGLSDAAIHRLVASVMGILGAFLGALALKHYRVTAQEDMDDDEDLREAEDEDIDYSTEPEDLVCLLTNQVVNRDHDKYVVCHNKFNVTSVCHAVYLMDYVHLLDGRCRRCYGALRERDLKGMG
jgi:hypothetical protein